MTNKIEIKYKGTYDIDIWAAQGLRETASRLEGQIETIVKGLHDLPQPLQLSCQGFVNKLYADLADTNNWLKTAPPAPIDFMTVQSTICRQLDQLITDAYQDIYEGLGSLLKSYVTDHGADAFNWAYAHAHNKFGSFTEELGWVSGDIVQAEFQLSVVCPIWRDLASCESVGQMSYMINDALETLPMMKECQPTGGVYVIDLVIMRLVELQIELNGYYDAVVSHNLLQTPLDIKQDDIKEVDVADVLDVDQMIVDAVKQAGIIYAETAHPINQDPPDDGTTETAVDPDVAGTAIGFDPHDPAFVQELKDRSIAVGYNATVTEVEPPIHPTPQGDKPTHDQRTAVEKGYDLHDPSKVTNLVNGHFSLPDGWGGEGVTQDLFWQQVANLSGKLNDRDVQLAFVGWQVANGVEPTDAVDRLLGLEVPAGFELKRPSQLDPDGVLDD